MPPLQLRKPTPTFDHLGYFAVNLGVAAITYWILRYTALDPVPRVICTIVLITTFAAAIGTALVLIDRVTNPHSRRQNRDPQAGIASTSEHPAGRVLRSREPVTLQAQPFRDLAITLDGTDISTDAHRGADPERPRSGASWTDARPDTIDVVLPVALGVLGRELVLQLPYRQLAGLIHDADRVQATTRRTQVQR